MKKARFTESPIVAILKEGEAGVSIAELLRKHGISRSTYFNWRSKYSDVSVSELKKMKELEAENAKLKRGDVGRHQVSCDGTLEPGNKSRVSRRTPDMTTLRTPWSRRI